MVPVPTPLPLPPNSDPSGIAKGSGISSKRKRHDGVISSPAAPMNRKVTADEEGDIFSPTSAAALALSTLHHFGADRDNNRRTFLRGTRLFNNASGSNGSVSNTVAVTPSGSLSKSNSNSMVTNGVLERGYSYPGATPTPTPTPPPYHLHHHHHSHHPPPPHPPATAYPSNAYADHHYGGRDHRVYERAHSWSEQPRRHHPAEATMPPGQAPWGHPPYPYPPTHSQDSGYSIDGHAPGHGSAPATIRPSPPPGRSYYAEEQHNLNVSHPDVFYQRHPRSTPPCVMGSSPPPPSQPQATPRSNNNFLPPQPMLENSEKFAVLPSSSPSTLVTPTPKKPKTEQPEPSSASTASTYSRKKKSLGVLAENFLKAYEGLPQGSTIVVDEAAVKLGVERRRIYDVVNILESICLVCKKHKNTYSWMGLDQLDAVFGRLQAQAILEYPEDAQNLLGITQNNNHLPPIPLKPPRRQSKTRENKSLAKLSQEFLQVFLVGHQTLSLPEASDKIQGTTSVEELIAMGMSSNSADGQGVAADPKELKAAAARGLKTKIRRLYDIANVFLSVGLLQKVESGDSSRRPNFSWSYRASAKALYELHRPNVNNDEADTVRGLQINKENVPTSEVSDVKEAAV